MPECVRIKRKHRKVCIGDLDSVITLQDRALTAPVSGVDATETFTDSNTDVWAMVQTNSGETIFDGVNTDINVTHTITISFIIGITSETWITLGLKRIDILSVENLEERDEWLVFKCTDRGTATNEATEA